MQRILSIVMLALSMTVAALLEAKQTVVGADLVKECTERREIDPRVMSLPFDQNEVGLFLEVLIPIENWVNKNDNNRKAWNTFAKGSLDSVRGLKVWETAGITSDEFITLTLKFVTASDMLSGQISANKLREQAQLMDSFLNDKNITKENKLEIRKAISKTKRMIKAMENYPAENIEIYWANKEELDAAVLRLKQLGRATTEPEN